MRTRTVLRWVALGTLATALLVGGLVQVNVQTDLHSFLPAGDSQTAAYDSFSRDYGGEPVVVLLETKTPQGIFSPAVLPNLVHLEGSLSHVDGTAVVDGPGTLLNEIAGQAQDFIAELLGRRDYEIALAQQIAKSAHRSSVQITAAGEAARAAFDARYGSLIVQGLPVGLPTLSNPKFAQHVIFNAQGQPRPEWHFLVPTTQAVAIIVRPVAGQTASQSNAWVKRIRAVVAQGTPPTETATVSGVPVLIAAISDRAMKDVPTMGAVAVVGVALILMAATWIRRRRRLVPLAVTLMSMVATVAMLGWFHRPLSLGVLAFATVILGVGSYYPMYLSAGARRRTVIVVACATGGSLATLMLSPVRMVQDLGLALALGVFFAAGAGLLASRWFPASGETTPVAGLPSSPVTPRILLVALVAVASLGWWQFGALRMQANVTDFAGGLPQLAQAQHVADILGSSGEVELVVRAARPMSPTNLTWSTSVEDQIVADHGDELRPALSPSRLLSFLGSKATSSEVDAALRLLPPYLVHAVAAPAGGSAVTTFGVRVDDLNALRASITDLKERATTAPVGTQATATGLPVVLLHGADLIESHRLVANLVGIGTAVLVIAVGFRRRGDTLRALAAAVLATGAGYALLWLGNGGLNPVSASLAALITAVGCEFTVVMSEASRRGSVRQFRAVAVGAATSVVGYAALLASHIEAVRGLGGVLAAATALAFGCSWLVVRAFPPTPTPEGAPDA